MNIGYFRPYFLLFEVALIWVKQNHIFKNTFLTNFFILYFLVYKLKSYSNVQYRRDFISATNATYVPIQHNYNNTLNKIKDAQSSLVIL